MSMQALTNVTFYICCYFFVHEDSNKQAIKLPEFILYK